MRELKFRAWDNKWSRWIDPEDVEVMGDGWVWCTRRSERGDEIETDALHDDNFVVEQYTGLKDKNGREIYEGDIVHGGYVVKWYESLGYDGRGAEHPGFYFLDELEYHLDLNSEVKVIGNIHSNAELLGAAHA